MGVVTSLIEESTHTNLRAITKVIGQQSPVTPKVLAARPLDRRLLLLPGRDRVEVRPA